MCSDLYTVSIARNLDEYIMCWTHCDLVLPYGTMEPGPWFNIKMTSYQYRISHCGDQTILRPSFLHIGISYTDKTTSLYWIGALIDIGYGTWWSQAIILCNIDFSYIGEVMEKLFRYQNEASNLLYLFWTQTKLDYKLCLGKHVICGKDMQCPILLKWGKYWMQLI